MEIYIRPLQETDALTSYKWRNDPEIWKYTGNRPNQEITQEMELNWIRKSLLEPNTCRFAICIQGSDKYIGNVQLTNIGLAKAEFHIFIGDKQYWNQGIATRATQIMLCHAKDFLKLKTLYLTVNPLNISAIKVYQKVGFIKSDARTMNDAELMEIMIHELH